MKKLSYYFIWLDFIIIALICSALNKININTSDSVTAFIIIAISSLVVLLCNMIKGNNSYERVLLSLAYISAIVLLYFDRRISPLEVGDTEGFHISAILKSQGDRSSTYGGIYTDIVGLIYRAFGPNRILGQYFNILLLVSILYVFTDMLYLFKIDEKSRKIGLFLIAFNPHFLIMNVILRRESIIIFLISLSFFYFLLWLKKQSVIEIVKSAIFGLLAAPFHSGVVSLILGYAICYILYNKKSKTLKLSSMTMVRIMICSIVFLVIFIKYNDIFLSKFNQYGDLNDTMEVIERGAGGSGYTAGFKINNIYLDYIINTPIRAAYFILSPMPWDWRGIGDIIAFVMSSMYYSFGFIYAWKLIRRNKLATSFRTIILSCVIILLICISIFSWGTRNAGTAMRHRDKFAVPYVFMISLTIHEFNKKECKKKSEIITNIECIE